MFDVSRSFLPVEVRYSTIKKYKEMIGEEKKH